MVIWKNVSLELEGMSLVLIHLCGLREYWYLVSQEGLASVVNLLADLWLFLED